MIENFGLGVDIIDVNRFRNIPYEEKTSFYNKIFNKNEIKYCLKFKDPYTHFAGKFAIKEAVKKSLNKKISMLKIHTYHINSKPSVKLIDDGNFLKFLVSISHEKNLAVAVVLSESF